MTPRRNLPPPGARGSRPPADRRHSYGATQEPHDSLPNRAPGGTKKPGFRAEMIERERTVYVWEKPHVVSVRRKTRGIWIAVGQYMGERIEVVDRSEASAVARWEETARAKHK
jgi:hypothetical protein